MTLMLSVLSSMAEAASFVVVHAAARRPRLTVHAPFSPTSSSVANFFPGLFFFERKYGTVITPQEVRQLLRGFGSINMCRHASALERAQYNLNEGVMVQFDLYDEGQAALQVNNFSFSF